MRTGGRSPHFRIHDLETATTDGHNGLTWYTGKGGLGAIRPAPAMVLGHITERVCVNVYANLLHHSYITPG